VESEILNNVNEVTLCNTILTIPQHEVEWSPKMNENFGLKLTRDKS